MLLAMMGLMIGLVTSSDLFNLWVWFEGMAISSYLLVAFYREQPASIEAGMNISVQSATGSVLVLMAIAIVWHRPERWVWPIFRHGYPVPVSTTWLSWVREPCS